MTESNPIPESPALPRPVRARSRRWLFVAIPGILLGALLGAQAYAFGPGGRHGHLSPERMERMIDRRLDGMLDRIDATADQRTRIKGTVARLKPEIKGLHEEKAKLHEAGRKALEASTLDPGEIERVRREAIKLADRGSSVMTRALVEVAGVLTPEQRKELLEHFQGHHRRWR
jgi:Spy/CpxP family protein refolding chaperone